MASNLSPGVEALVSRMQSHPAEFYGEAPKWRFIFKANFREVLTEPEKGAIHAALMEVRRKEFDDEVMRTLLTVEEDDLSPVQFREAMRLDSSGNLGIGIVSPSLQIGKQTLSEKDIEQFKSATTAPSLYK